MRYDKLAANYLHVLVRRCQRGAFVLQIPERPDSFATTLFAHEPLCESDQGRIWRKAEVGQLVVRHRGAVPTTQAIYGYSILAHVENIDHI
jgi:hypothetical protein